MLQRAPPHMTHAGVPQDRKLQGASQGEGGAAVVRLAPRRREATAVTMIPVKRMGFSVARSLWPLFKPEWRKRGCVSWWFVTGKDQAVH
ncbi:hypothetical protein CEXT_370471 [Caerostris extrusa]|uniref:Uncharacterized protein n=1 Tax=Caerostris extrusa TaxID=172846 RepID=A0AAV4M9J5_CAEEX|nr:hypothetical protein CEXT_370471 [Caerostris extrusa]